MEKRSKTPPKPGMRERLRRMEKEVSHFLHVLQKRQIQLDIASEALTELASNGSQMCRDALDKIVKIDAEMQSPYSQESSGTQAKSN
jgi:hypothetical protein